MSSVYSPVETTQREEVTSPIERRLARVGHSIQSFWGPIVITDFFIGLSLLFVGYNVTGSVPGGVVSAALIIFVGLFRKSHVQVKWGGILLIVMIALLVFLAVESRHNGMRWEQRDFKFLLILLAACVIASGRINIRSLIIGGVMGALINVPMFYLHLTPNDYPPHLTGFYLDKNVAGMYYALWGAVGLTVMPARWRRGWIVLIFVLLWLTGSRTSLAAYGMGLGYMLMRNRFGVTFRIIVSAIGFFVLRFLIENYAQSSAFGDRVGDDWFRRQIETATAAKVAMTPWYGLGLNQGTVVLGGVRNAYMHNSYQQAFVEGGWPFLLVILAAFLLVGLGALDRRVELPMTLVRLEGAVVVILICAWKLGEVFMTLGAFLVLGLCAAYRLGVPVDLLTAGSLEDQVSTASARRKMENAGGLDLEMKDAQRDDSQ